MLLIITLIIAILTGWLFYKNSNKLGFCALILLIACQGLLMIDSMQHFGTDQRTTMAIEKIAPVADIKGNKVMITEKIKQGKTIYTAYATKKSADSKITTILNKHKQVKVTFSSHNGAASKVTENDNYDYINHFAKLMYSGVTNNNQLKQQTIIYQLTSDWYPLSKHELKEVGKTLKAKTTQQRMKVYATGKIKQQLQKDPKLATSKKKMQQLENRYVKKYVGRIMKKETE
ncbi:MAG: DUF4811 domain-containing protein [Sporolactobacillus sp.]